MACNKLTWAWLFVRSYEKFMYSLVCMIEINKICLLKQTYCCSSKLSVCYFQLFELLRNYINIYKIIIL